MWAFRCPDAQIQLVGPSASPTACVACGSESGLWADEFSGGSAGVEGPQGWGRAQSRACAWSLTYCIPPPENSGRT